MSRRTPSDEAKPARDADAADEAAHAADAVAAQPEDDWCRVLFEQAAVGIARMTPQGRFVEVNPCLAELFGFPAEELLTRTAQELTHPDDRTAYSVQLSALQTGMTASAVVENRIVRRDGVLIWVRNTLSLIRDSADQALAIFAIVEDVGERRQAQRELEERANHAALAADVGRILTDSSPLRVKLQRCAAAVVAHLGVAFARIWTLNERDATLELRASAGIYTNLDGGHSRTPVGALKIGQIAQEGRPHLTNDILNDPRLGDREWARRERMVAFAGYPLIVEGRVLGVLAMFARMPLTESSLAALAAIADEIALASEQARIREAERLAHAEANRRMDEFLGIASHELRTPLTSAKASVEVAARQLERLTPLVEGVAGVEPILRKWEVLLARTLRQLDRQNHLVNDLLDVSRIQSGKLEMRFGATDLAAVVRDIVEEHRLNAPDRRIALRVAKEALGVARVRADALRIGQVVTNFLTNALKYSRPDTHVSVDMRLVEDGVRVAVRDRGPGLASEAQEHIWERYYRAPGIEVQSGSGVGLGLGLSISREIVERHGGRVGLRSAPGAGSVFWFALPLAEAAQV